MDKFIVGQLLRKKRRQEKGVTLEELYKKTGIAVSHISEIENGKTSVSLGKLGEILAALGIKYSEFMAEVEAIVEEENAKIEKKKKVLKSRHNHLTQLSQETKELYEMNNHSICSVIREKIDTIYGLVKELLKIENQVQYIRENIPDDKSYFQKETVEEDNDATADANAES